VGIEILTHGFFEIAEVRSIAQILSIRRSHFGDGVNVIDCGANIGVHTIEWAKHMADWGKIIGIEAQERIFYALAGNIAINNCFNAKALHAAVGATEGTISIPSLDHLSAANFGGLELHPVTTHPIGQELNYDENLDDIPCITIDSLEMERVDLIKIDVEGMELDVIAGAKETLARCKPVIMAEFAKVGLEKITETLQQIDYTILKMRMDVLAFHNSDPSLDSISAR
jgi:FkbM family methyltransferase